MTVQGESAGRVHALLIGIDNYRAVRSLSGCVNDVEHVGEFLQERLGRSRLEERRLCNQDATKDGIVAAIRNHLGKAGSGDVALLWFSGHGSEQPVRSEFWHLEPTGMSQTLVCHDSRDGGLPDLTDKELSVLLDRIAEQGAHIVVVLDCCHSGSGTRESGGRVRAVPVASAAPDESGYVAELREDLRGRQRTLTTSVRAEHVALSACRSDESAAEQVIEGEPQGVFTASLLDACQRLGSNATYRDLMLAARSRIENLRVAQTPVLYPAYRDSLADQAFLGGALISTQPVTARWTGDEWRIDVGSCHGIPSSSPSDPVLMAVIGRTDALFRVVEVEPGASSVVSVDWEPDRSVQ